MSFCKEYLILGNNRKKYNDKIEHNTDFRPKTKTLLSDMNFILEYVEASATILYIGNGKGDHLSLLVKMFPELTFFFYFDEGEEFEKEENQFLIKRKFSNDDVRFWREKSIYEKVYMISDKYTATRVSQTRSEAIRESDMEEQASWIEAIRPEAASLRFRLRYPTAYYKYQNYLDGKLYIQPWDRCFSTECRMVVLKDEYEKKVWDLEEFEQRMFYHNTMIREKNYYDQMATTFIIREYMDAVAVKGEDHFEHLQKLIL